MSGQTIMLVLTIIMPQDVPDKTHKLEVPTIEECWTQAHEFVERRAEILAHTHDAVGVAVACAVMETGEHT